MFKRRLRKILHTLCCDHVDRETRLEIAHELKSMRRILTWDASDLLRANDVYHARLAIESEIAIEVENPVPAAG